MWKPLEEHVVSPAIRKLQFSALIRRVTNSLLIMTRCVQIKGISDCVFVTSIAGRLYYKILSPVLLDKHKRNTSLRYTSVSTSS